MGTIARIATAVGLGAGTVVATLTGPPWPLIILGATEMLVLGTLAAVVMAAAFSRTRGRQAQAVLERLTVFVLGLRWPPPTPEHGDVNTARAQSGAPAQDNRSPAAAG